MQWKFPELTLKVAMKIFEIKTQRCNVKSNEGMEISTFVLRTCNANKMVAIAHIGLSYEN